jgi:hypothetical protein
VSSKKLTAVALAMAGLLAAGAGQAQQSAANPLDAVPEKMPFDVPYGAPISLERWVVAATSARKGPSTPASV